MPSSYLGQIDRLSSDAAIDEPITSAEEYRKRIKRKVESYLKDDGYTPPSSSKLLPSPSTSTQEDTNVIEAAELGGDATKGSSPRKKLKGNSGRSRSGSGSGSPVKEKRLHRVKTHCPKSIDDRVQRVMTQRFFMVDRHREGNELKEVFKVLGSVGNVYTVTISHVPSCDCPDALKGNHCKHILFIFLKVLGVPRSSQHWFQKALVTPELEEIFSSAPPSPSELAPRRLQQAYAQVTGSAGPSRAVAGQATEGASSDLPKKRIPEEGDSCPICYEEYESGKEDGLVFCTSVGGCGQAVHKECFTQWARTASKLTCVWCRASWVGYEEDSQGQAQTGSPSRNRNGRYINLAAEAGLPARRDTSTYYHGPRRGDPTTGRGYGGPRSRLYRDFYDYEEPDPDDYY